MASNPIPSGYGQFTLNWSSTGNARTLACTVGYLNSGAIAPDVAATRMYDSMAAGTGALADATAISAGYTFESIYALQNRAGILESATEVYDIDGVNTNAAPPVNTCIVVAKATVRAGRQFRGRFEWPVCYITEDDVNPNAEITEGVRIALATLFNNLHTEMVSRSIGPVLLHDQPNDPLAPIPTPTPITNFLVRTQLGSARRRLKRFTG